MNKRLVLKLLGIILLIEAAAMIPSLGVSLIYGDGDAMPFVISIGILLAAGMPAWHFSKPQNQELRAREGFTVVALAWLLLSLFGALPFVFSGMLPNLADALFESVSGFTTTGASVLCDFGDDFHGIMFWRSFTHWIGGMGVLVLTLALVPHMTGRSSHLIRAESPGPSLSKLVPRMGDTAKILYTIYGALTLALVVALMICGMNPYDAVIHAVGTAGTGGFSNYAGSVGDFNSVAVDVVITVFMLLFSLNFALYYKAITGGWKEALRDEELHWFAGMYAIAMLLITLMITPVYQNFFTALRYGSFQTASIISTTGFCTANFDQWPQGARALIVLVMFLGGCAGSTAGGMKAIRIALLCKLGKREVRKTFQPRKVQVVLLNGKGIEENLLMQITILFFVYVALVVLGAFLISLENQFNFETSFTAALTCVSNVGPGLGAVGPAGNFAAYSAFSKMVLCFLMLCGRLEIFPLLVLLNPNLWRKA